MIAIVGSTIVWLWSLDAGDGDRVFRLNYAVSSAGVADRLEFLLRRQRVVV